MYSSVKKSICFLNNQMVFLNHLPEWKLFLFLFCLGMVLKTVCLQLDSLLHRDSIFYIQYIEFWQTYGTEKLYTDFVAQYPIARGIPPLYPFCIKILAQISGISVTLCGQLLSMFTTSLIPVFCYKTAKIIDGNPKSFFALTAALLCTFHPQITRLGYSILRDGMSLMLQSCLLCFFVRMLAGEKHYGSIGFGVVLALNVFCRYETLEWIFPAAAAGLLACLLKKKKWISFFISCGEVILAFAAAFILLSFVITGCINKDNFFISSMIRIYTTLLFRFF